MFSAKSGVVSVGEPLAEVVTDEVVMPMSVVVTIVSISGEERAVKLVYVGVCVGTVDGVVIAPVADSFFSNLLCASPGGEPPRQGKQHRNSVKRDVPAHFHDYVQPLCARYGVRRSPKSPQFADGGN